MDHRIWTTGYEPQDMDHRIWTTGYGPQVVVLAIYQGSVWGFPIDRYPSTPSTFRGLRVPGDCGLDLGLRMAGQHQLRGPRGE